MSNTVAHIDAAIAAHEVCKRELLAAIETGDSESTPHAVKADNLCTFGQWLYNCPPEEKASPHHSIVKQIHAQFHMEAGRILEIALRGNKDNALAEMEGRYAEISSSLVAEMLKWKAECEEPEVYI
jgi:hypothetical protein